MSISSSWDLASDAELITAVRTGESAAFGVLYERHSAAARAVAHQYSNSAADAEDAAADAFQRVFATIQGGGGPDVAFRAYLFTVVRRVAMDRVHVGRRVQATDDLEAFEEAFGAAESSEDPTFAGFERSVVSRAYKSLPERWQAVLWYTEVEGLNPAEIAPVLGLTANGVAALAYRAREGLRQAYLQQHLAAPASEACTIVSSKLGAYVRGGLAKRETALVEMHLEECGDCRALVLELGDVNHGLRAIIAPLVLGAIGVGVLQGIGFGGAAGAVGAAAAAAGAGAGAGAGVGSGGAAVGSGGGVGVGAGAGTGGAGAVAGGSGAAAGAGSLVGAGAGLSAAASGVAAVGGAAALAASFGALQPAAASTGLTSGTTGTAGGVVAGGAAGSTAAAASTTGLAALVAGLPVTAIGLAAAGVIVAGAVAVAGTLGLFSPDDGSPDIVASEPELPDPGTDQGADEGSDEGSDEGTEGDTSTDDPADVVPPADPTNIPPVDDGTDNGSEPATVTPPTTAPTTPTTSTPTPTTEPTTPPNPPDPTPAELVVTPTTLASFVAGQEQIIPIGVANDGEQSAGVVHTELSFPTGTDVVVSALATPSGGGLARTIVPSTDWSCAPVSGTGEVTFTCTLPDLPANAESKLYAGVTITDDIDGGERDIAFGVRTWAPALGDAPVATRMGTRVASPATRITVGAVPAARLAGVTGDFARTGVTVPVTNTGTHAPAFVEVTGLPANVGVEWNAEWTCTRAATLVCEYPDLKRNETANLVLTLADTAALVDVDTTVTGPVTVTATGPTNAVAFDLAIASAPGVVDVEPPAMTTLQKGVARGVNLAVSNDGRTTARDLVIEVDLPESVSWYSSLHVVTDWTCVAGNGSNVDVRCTLPALAPGASSDLVVPVQTAAGTLHGDIVVRSLTGATTGPWSSPVRVVTSALVFSSPVTADLIRGASGPIAFAITNTGEAPAFHVSATITVPRSVSFDELSAMPGEESGWRCTRVSPQRLTCLLVSGRLDPGESAAAVVHATAEAAVVKQSVAVEVVDGLGDDAAVLTSSVEVNVPDAGLTPRGRWTGGYGVTEVGAPLLGCRGTSSAWCAAMSELGGGAQNNSYDMITLGASTSQLTIPANSDVAFAGLYWSANKYATDAWTGSQTQLALRGPDGVAQTIEGELIANVEDNASRDYYQSFADVTALVRDGGSGAWSAEGAAVAATRKDPNPSYYAGWSLVVVYTTPYEPEQNVTVYDGGAWVAANKSVTFAFEAGADRDGRIGVVAWDGDRGNTGDTLGLNGTSLAPRRWDGSLGPANDAFTSTATGSLYANSLGVDAKAFGSSELLDGINRLTASTGGDQYLIGAVTVQSTPR